MTKFGLWLKHWRISACMSQEDLARRVGLSNQRISSFELGTKEPCLSTLKKLSVAMGVDFHEMIRTWEAES